MKNKEVNMLSGSITKGLIAMMIPILVKDVFLMMFGIIDMTILGNFVNDAAVGAVGACNALITLFTGLLIGVSTGANVVVAKYIGRGDSSFAGRASGTGIAFAVAGGCVLMVFGVCCTEIMLDISNCPPELMDHAVIYLRLYFCGVPALMVYNFAASVLIACGDTKRPMYYLMIGGIIKVILNIGCITVFDMTVEGVAIATIVSNTVSGGLSLMSIFRMKEKLDFGIKQINFNWFELKKILIIGVPAGLQRGLYSIANLVIAATVNAMGPDATTGLAIANQFDGLLYYVACAPSVAITPYVAQNIGAGNLKRARTAIVKATVITIILAGSIGALSAVFSGQLSSIMTSSPAVIGYSRQKMIIISSTYFICGINEIMCGTLRGVGKPVIPTVATLLYMCLFRFVWVYLIFPLCPTMTFLYLVWPVGWILSIITLTVAYRLRISKMIKNEK